MLLIRSSPLCDRAVMHNIKESRSGDQRCVCQAILVSDAQSRERKFTLSLNRAGEAWLHRNELTQLRTGKMPQELMDEDRENQLKASSLS